MLPKTASFTKLEVDGVGVGVGVVSIITATEPTTRNDNLVFLTEVEKKVLRAQGPKSSLDFLDLANSPTHGQAQAPSSRARRPHRSAPVPLSE